MATPVRSFHRETSWKSCRNWNMKNSLVNGGLSLTYISSILFFRNYSQITAFTSEVILETKTGENTALKEKSGD